MSAELPELLENPDGRDLTLALNYKCNSACRFCFIEKELGEGLEDAPAAYIEEVFARNARSRAFKRLILSGAEATLRKDLPKIARAALERGGFEVVRLQTNGRRLSDAKYCRALIDAGLSEFFVSVHAPTAELDERMTRAPGGFREMREGLRNVRAGGARLISNSAVTRDNHARLPELAGFLLSEKVQECQFWAFLEFGDIGQDDQHVKFADSVPHLLKAVSLLREAGTPVVLSWFPECLLGPHAGLLKNHGPMTLIDERFKSRMTANGRGDCAHAASCSSFGRRCFGIHPRHKALLGDERAALTPL